jgi:hypothetical protein
VKLYKSTADALLWDSAVGYESMQFAAMYENLSPAKQALLTIIWKSIIEDGVPDDEVLRTFVEMARKREPSKAD